MTADGNNAYLAGGPYVYAVNLQTGAQTWRFPDKPSAANPFYAPPVLTPDGGQLIVGGYDKKLYSIDPKTGKSTWQFADARDRWIGGVLATDKMIYAPNADYKLYALEFARKLAVVVRSRSGHLEHAGIRWNQHLFRDVSGEKYYAVNAQTGKQAWMQSLDGAVLGSPVLGKNNDLYVGTYGGTVYVLNTSTGESRVLKQASTWIWSGPILDGTDLYVGDANGKLFAFLSLVQGSPGSRL